MKPITLLFFIFTICNGYSQKKLITNDTYKDWYAADRLGQYAVSDNGEYIWYQVGRTFNVCRSNGQPVQKIEQVDMAYFTADSKALLFIKENKLHQLDLKTLLVEKLPYENVATPTILSERNTIVFLQNKKLILRNIKTGKEQTYDSVSWFKLNDGQTDMVAKKGSALCWIDLRKNQLKTISQIPGIDFGSVKFDNTETRLLFKVKQGKDKSEATTSYYYYDKQMPAARLFLNNETSGLPAGYKITDDPLSFSRDGSYVCFKLQPDKKEEKKEQYQAFWHYQTKTYHYPPYIAFASLSTKPGASIQILGEGEIEVMGLPGLKYVLLKKGFMHYDDLYWNKDMEPEFTLVSLEDGKKTAVVQHDVAPIAPRFLQISPNEKYIIWFDYTAKDYLSYNINTGKIINITKNIDVPSDIKSQTEGSVPRKMEGQEQWIDNDEAIILRDKYDFWQIDPSGQKPPINLTNGYGRKNKVEFMFSKTSFVGFPGYKPLAKEKEVILRAMNTETGENGFWQIKLGQQNNLEEGHLHPCLFSWPLIDEPKPIMKAAKATVFLITRQTAAEQPNLYVTTDLKSYKKLTDIAFQKEYNWMTSELIRYPMKGGRMNSAILFKPENFNPAIKYPVIFNYYQERSMEVHKFRQPDLFRNNIDVAWFVSNGYLVCMPDIINDEPGKIAKTTVNSVESAADYLAQYPWFDGTKMGCQGQSFGGYETNLLVANSHRFAAANSMAGMSNLFSGYFGNAFGERSATWFHEKGQTNLDTTPWANPEVYIENSPVMQADKATTPLLIIHNRDDGAVTFNQAYEFFYALRRLKKPVWLYEYDGGHTEVGSEESCLDFTIRQEEFFNHYLKGKPAPKWMTEGVSVKIK